MGSLGKTGHLYTVQVHDGSVFTFYSPDDVVECINHLPEDASYRVLRYESLVHERFYLTTMCDFFERFPCLTDIPVVRHLPDYVPGCGWFAEA